LVLFVNDANFDCVALVKGDAWQVDAKLDVPNPGWVPPGNGTGFAQVDHGVRVRFIRA
jgi:hypothetical protein